MRLLKFLPSSFFLRKGLLLIGCILPLLVGAQQWEWALYNKSTGNDFRWYYVDRNGNTYLNTLYNGVAGTMRQTLSSFGMNKISTAGKFLWNDSSGWSTITTRDNGNIIVFGNTNTNLKFDSIYLSIPLYPKYEHYCFLAECDRDGHWLRAKIVGQDTYISDAEIVIGDNREIYISGTFNEKKLILFPNDTLWSRQQNGASEDIFIAKFDTNFECAWAKELGNEYSWERIFSQELDKYGNFCLGYTLYDPKQQSIRVIKKYSPTGKLIFDKEIARYSDGFSDHNYLGYHFVIERESNDFITTISLNIEMDFGDGIKRKPLANSNSRYLARYDQDWKLKWLEPCNSGSYAYITDLAIDKKKNICLTGSFSDTFFVRGKKVLVGDTGANIFLAKLDGFGNVLSAAATTSPCDAYSSKLYVDDCENMYVWGGAYCNNHDPSHRHQINMGRFQLKGPDSYNNGLYFLAKLNAHNFGFDRKPSCTADTFHFKGDTAFKTFSWQFSDGTVLNGKDVVFHPKDTGWYYVELECHTAQGCSANYQDSIYRPANPKAFFTITENKLCQYTTVSIADSSFPRNVATGIHNKHWDFGDGTTYDGLNAPKKIYSAPGKYKMTLTYDLGFCKDSFSRIVIVEPGAVAGFTVSDSVGCLPFPVLITPKTKDKTLKYKYVFGDGSEDSVMSPTHTYNQIGNYWLREELTSLTGCVSKDSTLIHVRDGVTIDDTPHIIEVGYIRPNRVLLIVVSHSTNMHHYDKIYRNQAGKRPVLLGEVPWAFVALSDYSWTDSLVEENPTEPFWYTVVSEDSCGHTSSPSKPAAPPFLFGENIDNVFYLRWTPYEALTPRSIRYMLYAADTKSKLWNDSYAVASYNLQLNCLDSLQTNNTGQQCYRITATGGWAGGSNLLCLPQKPIIWIPNAFSPNRDGVNDTFKIVSFDISNMSISIYNSWGERVFTGSGPSIEWDGRKGGLPLPDGVYLFTLEGRTAQHERIYKTGTINLLH